MSGFVDGDGDTYCVVAGFDGRWQDVAFLRHAAHEAVSRGWPLVVVTILRQSAGLDRGPRAVADTVVSAGSARDHLARAASQLRMDYPTLSVRAFTMDENDLATDRYPLDRAGLVVVGSAGMTGLGAGRPGSIGRRLVRMATCAVLLIPEDAPAGHRAGQAPDALTG